MHRLILFATLLVAPLTAQTPPPPVTVPTIPFTRYVLKNGLTLIVHEDHKAPIVAVNVWYHVGSKNEKPGKTGFAHLFEHLMFNGSENHRAGYLEAVEPVGATDLNGTTNNDRTNYFENVPVSALDRILWLESDRMGHLLGAIDQGILDEQRGVVQNEKRQSENEPYGKQWITIAENTYPAGHPYSWDVIGSMADLSAASLDDVKEWFTTYYGAANAVLVVAGDVQPENIRQRVERYFGDIPSGPPVIKQAAWVAKRTGEQRQVMQDRVPQARVVKVWNVPGTGMADQLELGMAVDILGSGKTSRLYKRLVYTDRVATSVVAYYDDREIGGQVVFWADAQPGGDLKAVERTIDEEIGRFLRDGPTSTEVDEVRIRRLANYVTGIERIGGFGGKSDLLAQGEVYQGDPAAVTKTVERAQRVTAADILAASKRWLDDGVYVMEVHPFPDYETIASTVDRSRLPDVGTPPPVPFSAAERATLPNGLKVQLVRRTAVPAVTLSLLFDAGYAADQSAAPGTASMMLNMLDEGTATRSSEQISAQLAGLGAELGSFSNLDGSVVSLTALRDRLEPALAIYADVVLNPSFPAKELDRLKQNAIAEIQQEKVQPYAMALRVLPRLLYGEGHAYGTPLTGSGTEAAVQGMTREDLVRFHRAWFSPGNATLVVVGDITMAELRPLLDRAFAPWKAAATPTKRVTAVPPRAGSEVYLLDRPGAEQSYVLVAQLAPPRQDAHDIELMLFNDAFGGAFGSRVNLNLREDKHWSYGAYAGAFGARGPQLWFVIAPVQTDKTKESIQEVIREIQEVGTSRPISATELQEAKDRQVKTLAGRWETGSAVASSLREIINYRLPEDYYATFADRVNRVTVDAVATTVKRTLQPDRLVYVIVGDQAKIEAGIRSLNLGPIHYLDGDGQPKK